MTGAEILARVLDDAVRQAHRIGFCNGRYSTTPISESESLKAVLASVELDLTEITTTLAELSER